MKSLLRSSMVALIIFAGYAALATDINKPSSHAGPTPMCVPPVSMSQSNAGYFCPVRPN
ncbi:MAG TPA: hypothetical protein VGN44_05275 [Candidatus Angelobacter sp.]|jgi:hypothetical protein